MTKVTHGKGWVEPNAEPDDKDCSLKQAFEDIGVIENWNSRLLHDLLEILKEEDNSILKNRELRALIPTVVSAFVSQMPDDSTSGYQGELSFYQTLISNELNNVLKSVSDKTVAASTLKTACFGVLESINLQKFSRLLVDILKLEEIGVTEARTTATEQVLRDFFTIAIEDFSNDTDRIKQQIRAALVETFKNIKPIDLIRQIADRLYTDLQGSITVASFRISDEYSSNSSHSSYGGMTADKVSPKHTNSPVPEHVLAAVRNEVFRRTEIPNLQTFYQKLEEKNTIVSDDLNEVGRDLFVLFTEILPDLIDRKRELGVQLGEQVISEILEAMKQMTDDPSGFIPVDMFEIQVSDLSDRLSEIFKDVSGPFEQKQKNSVEDWQRFIEEVRRIFYNLDWLLFPIARYFVQDNIPGGIKYRAGDQLDSEALEAAVSDSIHELFQIEPLDKRQQQRAVLALEESQYLGLQVLEDIKNNVKNHPMPYGLFLSMLVKGYERFLDGLGGSLAHIQQSASLSISDSQTFLEYIPRQKMLGQRSQTVFVPMTYASEKILEKCQENGPVQIRLPYCVDLSYWLRANSSNQGKINACTAFVVKQIVEFLYHKIQTDQPNFEVSALFLYQAALENPDDSENLASTSSIRDITKIEDSPGISIRKIIKTLVHLGAPPEGAWRYPIDEQDAVARMKESPSPACYFSAQKIRITKYFRLDQRLESDRYNLLLTQIKAISASGVPCMLAIKAMDALDAIDDNAYIPYSSESEAAGHALIVAGYDDTVSVDSSTDGKKGALLVRNSWGDDWGKGGYAWLPYEYVLESNRVVDCWALLEWQWMKKGNFGLALEGWQKNVGTPIKPGDVISHPKSPPTPPPPTPHPA